jgi:hypothetical protein
VLFHADCVKHGINGIFFQQFQIFAVRASQTLLTFHQRSQLFLSLY